MPEQTEMEEIYEEYAKPVYQYLYSLCHQRQTAEDLTQETFYEAMKSIGRYNGQCKLIVWLCQIGKHLWYRELEKRKKRSAVSLERTGEMETAQGIPEDFLGDENRVALFRAMQALDETTREVIYLRAMGELKFQQIADIMGRTENWARVTFYRGKERLRKGWENSDERTE